MSNRFNKEQFFCDKFGYTSLLEDGAFGVFFEAKESVKIETIPHLVSVLNRNAIDENNPWVIPMYRKLEKQSHPNISNVVTVMETTLTDEEIKDLTQLAALSRVSSEFVTAEPAEVIIIWTELCGNPLYDWILVLEGDLDVPFVNFSHIAILQNVIDGISFLHERNITNGRIDPQHILFSISSTSNMFSLPVKLSLCYQEYSLIEYEAPERFDKDFDYRVDLYSLGKVMKPVCNMQLNLSGGIEEQKDGNGPSHLILNAEELIIGLLQPVHLRIQDIRDVVLIVESASQDVAPQKGSHLDSNLFKLYDTLGDPQGERWFKNLSFQTCLGAGAFGLVLEAMNKETTTKSAVKIILPKEGHELVFREFETVYGFNHRNVVRLFHYKKKSVGVGEIDELFNDLVFEDEQFDKYEDMKAVIQCRALRGRSVELTCLEMELCGYSLRHVLSNPASKIMDMVWKIKVIHCVIEGVKFLHVQKIMRRDLKPENIYFSVGNLFPVKIGDFGLSRKMPCGDEQLLTVTVGTLTYMAPEVKRNQQYTLQSDIFSLGLIIWEVAALVQNKERSFYFQSLVYDGDTRLITSDVEPYQSSDY